MSDNILIIFEELAEIQRMLASIQANVQAVKRDVEEFRRADWQQLREIVRTAPDSSRR